MTTATDPSEALARAEALEAEGRSLDAIDTLLAANRAGRDGTIERRLVELRHRAFDTLDPTPGRSSWPPVEPDLFAGAGSPPELPVADLTAQKIASAIVNHGSLIVRGLLSPERVDQLRTDIQRAFAARTALREDRPPGADEPWFVPFASGRAKAEGFGNEEFVRAVDSPATMFDLTEAYTENGLLALINEHFGERPAVSANKCALRCIVPDPDNMWGAGFHQDGAFLGADIRALNVWLALSDCGGDADAPGLDLVPRRLPEVVPTGTEGAMFHWSVSPTVVAEVTADSPVVRPVLNAGDAVLFDELLLHSTGLSVGMTRERYAIECWFFAPSRYPPKHVPAVI